MCPENWVLRRPVAHFCDSQTGRKARYPPRNFLNALYKRGPRESRSWEPTATYYEPPLPIITGRANFNALKNIAQQRMNIKESVHVLHILRAVFEEMGRSELCCDRWLQRGVTVPSRMAIERYKNELQTFSARENGYPGAPATVKQCFKNDQAVRGQASQLMNERRIPQTNSKARTKVLNNLFEKAENTPGALDRYHMVEKDLERFSRDLKLFKEHQREFDKERGYPYDIKSVCEAFMDTLDTR